MKDGERGEAEAPVPRSDVSFRLDQKTGNFKAPRPFWEADLCSGVILSNLTDEKKKNRLAQTEFCFIKTTIITKAASSTLRPSRLYQRCTAAKDGKLQGCQREQTDAVKSID